jgi:exodeoxyribonuclease III
VTIKLLSYNIKLGGVGREDLIASVINADAPDIVLLQEATRPHVVHRVAELTGLSTVLCAAGRSVACITRFAIERHRYVRPPFSQHAFLEVVPKDLDVRFYGVHLSAVHAAWTERRRVRELRSMLAAIRDAADAFHIIAGDFNTLAPNEALDVTRLPYRLRVLVWLSGGRIRWQTIAIMLGANYVDAYRTTEPTGPGYTFPTWEPHVRLDYAFLSKAGVDRLISCAVATEPPQVKRASDHFPLRIEFQG